MQDSAFTKILTGEVPRTIIYQDERCFVVLTHEPITPGHMLVIPKQQIDNVWDIPTDLYDHLWEIARGMSSILEAAYGYVRIGSMVDGFGVPNHAHIHVVGLNEGFEPTIASFLQHRRIEDLHELKAEEDKILSYIHSSIE